MPCTLWAMPSKPTTAAQGWETVATAELAKASRGGWATDGRLLVFRKSGKRTTGLKTYLQTVLGIFAGIVKKLTWVIFRGGKHRIAAWGDHAICLAFICSIDIYWSFTKNTSVDKIKISAPTGRHSGWVQYDMLEGDAIVVVVAGHIIFLSFAKNLRMIEDI